MNGFAQLAVIMVLSLAGAGTSWLLRQAPAKPEPLVCDPSLLRDDEICLADAKGNVLWVDARSRKEWETNGLKDSILWNMDPKEDVSAFESEAAPRILESEMVVVYCGSKKCGTSREVANRIRGIGLGPPVKVLYGGWDAIKGSSSAP